ncbi:MAG: cupin domain-containing protein [Pseudomonadota bacterium]
MTKQPFAVLPEDDTPALSVFGDKITVLATSAATGGSAITRLYGREGSGPPPHSHDWDESFFVIRGEVEFSFGGETRLARPGSLVHLPAGTVHSFRFGPGGAELLEITGAGSRAVELFTALDREVPTGTEDPAKIAAVMAENGVTLGE